MNGLGIVLEEPSTVDSSNKQVLKSNRKSSNATEVEESLLPPLPDEDNLNESISISLNAKDEESDSYTENNSSNSNESNHSNFNVLTNSMASSMHGFNEEQGSFVEPELHINSSNLSSDNDFFYKNSNNSFSTYELDSPSINLDPFFSSMSNNNSSRDLSRDNKDKETSPLKRLKSLKKSIRKLSLSKSNSASNVNINGLNGSSTNITGINPTYSASTSNITSSLGPALNPITTSILSSKMDRPQLSPLQNHFKTLSLDSNGSVTTGESKVKCMTPTTPPYLSPIITLTDNGNVTKESLQKIEQNYFSTFMKTQTQEDVPQEKELVDIQDQTTLMNYYNYLINERSLITETYNLTKSRLVKSGWCSTDDLNNLSIQKNNQLCQIDSKLKEINMKLVKCNE